MKILLGEVLRKDCEECHGSGTLRDDDLVAECSYCVAPDLLAPSFKYRITFFDDRLKKKSRRQGRGQLNNPAGGEDFNNFAMLSFHFKAANYEAANTLATRFAIRHFLSTPYNLRLIK